MIIASAGATDFHAIEDAIADMLPEDAPRAEVLDALADTMAGQIERYKSARGLRGYLARYWGVIAEMGFVCPERHDDLLRLVIERLDMLTGQAADVRTFNDIYRDTLSR